MSTPFYLFGVSHAIVLALTIAVPVLLACVSRARHDARLRAFIRLGFADLLIASWAAWYLLFALRGWLTIGNILPMNLCDWAMIVTLVTLIRPHQASFDLAYFWTLAGATQALLTPDVRFDFPDLQFIVFFLDHAIAVAAVFYLVVGLGMRPRPHSIPRVIGWSVIYLSAAGLIDWLLDVNYGFLRASPHQVTLYDHLSSWPYYIPETALIGLALVALLYTPFFVRDILRGGNRDAAFSQTACAAADGDPTTKMR